MKIVKRYLVSAIVSLGFLTTVSVANATPMLSFDNDLLILEYETTVSFSGDSDFNIGETVEVDVLLDFSDMVAIIGVNDLQGNFLINSGDIQIFPDIQVSNIDSTLFTETPESAANEFRVSDTTLSFSQGIESWVSGLSVGQNSNISFFAINGTGFNSVSGVDFLATPIPLPAGGLLFGTALFGLGMVHRRKAGRV